MKIRIRSMLILDITLVLYVYTASLIFTMILWEGHDYYAISLKMWKVWSSMVFPKREKVVKTQIPGLCP